MIIWALYGSSLVVLVLLLAVALPADVRQLVLENCKNSKGRFRLRYISKEVVAVSRFYGELLFVTVILTIVCSFGLIVVDHFVKLEIIHSAAEQADWDLDEWTENLRSSPSNVEKQFTQFHIAQGGTPGSARSTMIFLWCGLPVMLLLCLVAVVVTMRLSSGVFKHALQSLIKEETLRNRRRTQQRYLRSTASSVNAAM